MGHGRLDSILGSYSIPVIDISPHNPPSKNTGSACCCILVRTLVLVVVICLTVVVGLGVVGLVVVVGLGVVGLVVATAPPIWKFTIAPSDRDSRQQPQTTRRVKRCVLEKCIYYFCQFHCCKIRNQIQR